MAKYTVAASGGQWRVVQNGTTVSNHRKKSAAVSAARRKASSGDRLIVQRTNGTIQSNSRVR